MFFKITGKQLAHLLKFQLLELKGKIEYFDLKYILENFKIRIH